VNLKKLTFPQTALNDKVLYVETVAGGYKFFRRLEAMSKTYASEG
jgi:hypothetical protein